MEMRSGFCPTCVAEKLWKNMSAEPRESYFSDKDRRKHTQISLQEGLRRELNDAESILVSRNRLIVNVVKRLQANRSNELVTIG